MQPYYSPIGGRGPPNNFPIYSPQQGYPIQSPHQGISPSFRQAHMQRNYGHPDIPVDHAPQWYPNQYCQPALFMPMPNSNLNYQAVAPRMLNQTWGAQQMFAGAQDDRTNVCMATSRYNAELSFQNQNMLLNSGSMQYEACFPYVNRTEHPTNVPFNPYGAVLPAVSPVHSAHRVEALKSPKRPLLLVCNHRTRARNSIVPSQRNPARPPRPHRTAAPQRNKVAPPLKPVPKSPPKRDATNTTAGDVTTDEGATSDLNGWA
eukprot:Selendium_serpulae@DN5177_c0_g1_i5.p1